MKCLLGTITTWCHFRATALWFSLRAVLDHIHSQLLPWDSFMVFDMGSQTELDQKTTEFYMWYRTSQVQQHQANMTQRNCESRKKFESSMATSSRKTLQKPSKYTVLNPNHSVKSLEKLLCDQAAWHTGHNSPTKFLHSSMENTSNLKKSTVTCTVNLNNKLCVDSMENN